MAAPEADTEEIELPVGYSLDQIHAELAHWTRKLAEAKAGTGQISARACLAWVDKWLDEYLDRRGR